MKRGGSTIGTPCYSFLFHNSLENIRWSSEDSVTGQMSKRTDGHLSPGLYEVTIKDWPLEKEIDGTGRIGNIPKYYKAEGISVPIAMIQMNSNGILMMPHI
eukprot:CCRYP_009073-RA/>CCRYP_009073-RA protein AED:0.46 eAED:0.61 QI:0/0/0/1/0/0/2/0/100